MSFENGLKQIRKMWANSENYWKKSFLQSTVHMVVFDRTLDFKNKFRLQKP